MDVRMLNLEGGGGRPFCCEVIDAFRVPSGSEIALGENIINGITSENNDVDENELDYGSYGKNPSGVGVKDMCIVNSAAFSGLQKETEDKIKHYGCVCWTDSAVKTQSELDKLLTRIEPTNIKQKTPVRVMHRRSNIVRERSVLKIKAERINDHWFNLFLTTNAGTYVKEFVTGDLNRTVPSVSGMLGGGRVDIMQLDCCGLDTGE